jgi:hypothetical protein
MKRKAVVVVNTAIDFDDTFVLDFTEFCAEWLSRHSGKKMSMEAKLLYILAPGEKAGGAERFLESLSPSFNKRGIDAEPLVMEGSVKDLAFKVNILKPEAVFLTESKLANTIRDNLEGLLVEYPDPRKSELRASEVYGVAALLLYVAIFTYFEVLKGIIVQKSFVSVALVLGTVLAVAYLYGNTVSHALKYLGITPRHAR